MHYVVLSSGTKKIFLSVCARVVEAVLKMHTVI